MERGTHARGACRYIEVMKGRGKEGLCAGAAATGLM